MQHLYHRDAFDTTRPVPSYWEATAGRAVEEAAPLDADTRCDVAVIGGGYTGLSAALHLARDANADTLVLEAGRIGWGASGRNGGFCCLGSHKLSNGELVARYGRDGAIEYFQAQREAVELVRELGTSEEIDFDGAGNGETTLAHLPSRVAELREEAAFLKDTYGVAAELLGPADLAARGMASTGFYGGLHLPIGFGLHPGKYVRGLAYAAMRRGARIAAETPVTQLRRADGRYELVTPRGKVSAERVLIATNGYTPEALFPGLRGRLLPALSNAMVTRPLSDAELQAQGWTTREMAFDSRYLLHYFRLLPDRRFLFGARGGFDASQAGERRRSAALERDFRALFPAWRDVAIDYRWSGMVCLARDRVPHLGEFADSPGLFHALAYHGNGVAMASWAGRAMAQLMTGNRAAAGIPAALSRPLPAFPFPPLRLAYLQAAYAWYGLKDRR